MRSPRITTLAVATLTIPLLTAPAVQPAPYQTRINPAQGPPSTAITVSGHDWPAGHHVLGYLSADGHSHPVIADGSGDWTTHVTNTTFLPTSHTDIVTAHDNFAEEAHARFSTVDTPAAPSDLTATALGSNSVHLTWHDNSANKTGSWIYVDGAYTRPHHPANSTASAKTDVTDLRHATNYCFKFGVFENTKGGSGQSVPACVTPGPTTVRYVALGDSYSSGEGNPPFEPRTDTLLDRCHRSPQAWPLQLANDSTVLPHLTIVGHSACSGAVASDITATPRSGELPQVLQLALLNPAPDLVTITIGGNDAGFAGVLASCFTMNGPLNCTGVITAAKINANLFLRTWLKLTFRAVRAVVPSTTRIIVVGYPNIFPSAFSASVQAHCPWLAKKELQGLDSLASLLNVKESQAAAAAGVEYDSVIGALNGHELCTPLAKSWMYPIGLLNGPYSGHPITPGQRAIKDAVKSYINATRR